MPVGGPTQKGKGGGTPAPKGPAGVRIEHRVGIQAPADVIWETIYDLEGWSRWNPFYVQASGEIHIGETLNVTQVVPGERPQQLRPVVLEWVPNEQLHWRTSSLGGLVKAIDYIEIETLAEQSCIISSGEILGGMMGPGLARRVGGRLHRCLRQMNEALKAEAEARWAARAGGG